MSTAANYQSDGMENLRANPTFRESPGPQTTPGTAGKPCGGTENLKETTTTFNVAAQKVPTGGSGPSIPQSFNDADVVEDD